MATLLRSASQEPKGSMHNRKLANPAKNTSRSLEGSPMNHRDPKGVRGRGGIGGLNAHNKDLIRPS